MAIERHFIDENVKRLVIRKFTEKKLEKVGCGKVQINRTPLGMRITIFAEKPGLVIGRKGRSIQQLTDAFRDEFKLENPQLEVQEIDVPELNPVLMAQKIAGAMEQGIHFRRAVYSTIRRIMDSGALGCEITISGKLTGERSRVAKFLEGFIKHAGETKEEMVLEGIANVKLKVGVVGIKVRIVPPGTQIKEITRRVEAEKKEEEKPKEKEEEGKEEKPKEKEAVKEDKPAKEKPEKEEKKEVEKAKKKAETKKPKEKAAKKVKK